MATTKRLHRLARGFRSNKYARPALFAVAFAAAGVVTLALSHAATPVANIEAESGTVSSNASLITDSSASGSHAVKFGASGSQPLTCNLNATTANFAAQVSAATAGKVVCLAMGSYGTFSGVNKAITIAAQNGATPTMDIDFGNSTGGFTLDGLTISGGQIGATSVSSSNPKNITVRNSTVTQTIDIQVIASGILFDNDTFNNIDDNATCTEYAGRIELSGIPNLATDLTVQNSLFSGGNKDGIQAGGPMTIKNNTFTNIREKGANDCQHTDSIQGVGTTGVVVTGNLFYNDADGIVDFDDSTGWIITNNACYSVDRGACVTLYGDLNSVVEHNTAGASDGVLE